MDGGDVMWVAEFGCRRVAEVHKTTSRVRIVRVHEEDPFAFGGTTGAELDANKVYCSNGSRAWVIDRSAAAASTLLKRDPMRRLTGLRPLVAAVYFLEGVANDTSGTLLALPVNGGAVEELARTRGGGSFLHQNARRGQLYWHIDFQIVAFDLASNTSNVLATGERRVGHGTQDADHLYWLGEHTVMRIKKR